MSDEIKELKRLLDRSNDLAELERALGNHDQDVADLERALGGIPKSVKPDGMLVDLHRAFIGKCCSTLRGYIVKLDEKFIYLSSKPSGSIESKVPRGSITDIKVSQGGQICIEPE